MRKPLFIICITGVAFVLWAANSLTLKNGLLVDGGAIFENGTLTNTGTTYLFNGTDHKMVLSTPDRTLWDSSGSSAVNFQQRYLIDNGGTQPSLDWNNRALMDSVGANVLIWSTTGTRLAKGTFTGDLSNGTNILHGNTVTIPSGGTVALTKNADGSTNFALTITTTNVSAPLTSIQGPLITTNGNGVLNVTYNAGALSNYSTTNLIGIIQTNNIRGAPVAGYVPAVQADGYLSYVAQSGGSGTGIQTNGGTGINNGFTNAYFENTTNFGITYSGNGGPGTQAGVDFGYMDGPNLNFAGVFGTSIMAGAFSGMTGIFQSIMNGDGSGSFANGNFTWDTAGNVTAHSYNTAAAISAGSYGLSGSTSNSFAVITPSGQFAFQINTNGGTLFGTNAPNGVYIGPSGNIYSAKTNVQFLGTDSKGMIISNGLTAGSNITLTPSQNAGGGTNWTIASTASGSAYDVDFWGNATNFTVETPVYTNPFALYSTNNINITSHISINGGGGSNWLNQDWVTYFVNGGFNYSNYLGSNASGFWTGARWATNGTAGKLVLYVTGGYTNEDAPFHVTAQQIGTTNGAFAGSGTTLLTSLVGYWNMDEPIASGTRADSTANADALTDINNNVPGVIAHAVILTNLSFNGTVGPLQHADNATLSLGANTDFSISCWGYLNTVSALQCLVDKGLFTSAKDNEFVLNVNSSAHPVFIIGNGTLTTSVTGATTLLQFTKYHFVATYNSSAQQLHLYVNGSEDANSPVVWTGGTQDTTYDFSVGGPSTGTSYYCNAYLDEVGYWHRALTSSEVTSLYNSGNGLAYSSFGSTP